MDESTNETNEQPEEQQRMTAEELTNIIGTYLEDRDDVAQVNITRELENSGLMQVISQGGSSFTVSVTTG